MEYALVSYPTLSTGRHFIRRLDPKVWKKAKTVQGPIYV